MSDVDWGKILMYSVIALIVLIIITKIFGMITGRQPVYEACILIVESINKYTPGPIAGVIGGLACSVLKF